MLCTNNGEPKGVLRFIWRRERESGWETEAIFSPILMMWSFYRIRERLLKIG